MRSLSSAQEDKETLPSDGVELPNPAPLLVAAPPLIVADGKLHLRVLSAVGIDRAQAFHLQLHDLQQPRGQLHRVGLRVPFLTP
jgi:hypothetical protein